MSERKQLIVSIIVIMACVALVVAGTTISILYNTAFKQQRERLVETARSQARLIESIARFDAKFRRDAHPEGAAAATLAQIREAHNNYEGFGATGEFVMGKQEGDMIVFLLSHRHFDHDNPRPVAWEAAVAEPMRRALLGMSGTIVGLDYRDEFVLAAHEPVAVLNFGIVVKTDLNEIRAPFVQAGFIAGGVAILAIACGAFLVFRFTNPLIQRLQSSERRTRVIAQAALDAILVIDEHGIIKLFNPAAEVLFGYRPHEAIGRNVNILMPDPPKSEHDGYLQKYLKTGRRRAIGNRLEVMALHRNGNLFAAEVSISESKEGERSLFVGVVRDLTERKRSEAEREELNRQLLDASRHAGMAEIATGVLHNVGNVLNSVNVSAGVIQEKIKHSEIESLNKVVSLLGDHKDDLGRYITEDDAGRNIPQYLIEVVDQLVQEDEDLLVEVRSLTKNIEHIKDIVSMQQSYAGVSGVVETVSVTALLDDACRLSERAFERHHIELRREYEDLPPISVDKHKVLQILINLVRNAKHALTEGSQSDKMLTLRAFRVADDRVRFEVADNGVGIPDENMSQLFVHGFTTRKDGHGFGLHSSALAAKELDGSLTVRSDGVGKGAVFALELPLQPQEASI